MATMVAPLTADELPAPEEDPIKWNVIFIADQPCPGQYVSASAEGERERDVEHKKSKGSSRDILVDQGLNPKEVSIVIRTTNGDVLRSLQDFYLRYMDPERAFSKLNVVNVSHPQFYARGIKQLYFYAAQIPKPTHDGGIYPLLHTFKAKIISPKTQLTTAAGGKGSKKPQAQQAVGGPTDPAFRQQVTAIGQSIQNGTLFFNASGITFEDQAGLETRAIVPVSRPRPPNQSVFVPPPTTQRQLASAGDPSARFSVAQLDRYSPR
jgi:hypothetical protein